ncbi:MAG TPA: IPT/TIG domain-containing protein [Thermoanaerobaculia bacterium]|nr:IPT/TIG domain-containing protein [Thermoanaerobaculia bacterium]
MLLSGSAFALPPQPDVPECRGLLTKKIIAQATVGKSDPAAAYANKAKLPPSLRCASALWQALHPAPRRFSPADAEGIRREKRTAPLRVEPYQGPPPTVTVHPVRTPPLSKMPIIPPPFRGEKETERTEPPHPERPTDTAPPEAEPHRQKANGPVRSAPVASGISFEGVGSGLPGYFPNAVPPDTNGRVGATQYVQWNNTSFAIWDKSGKKLYGPAAGNTLFQPLGGVCALHNDGDPVVSYDLIAGRWVLSQLVVYGGNSGFSHQCVAVSVTSDATGSWYLYDFVTDQTNFVDYPHTAVWSDGYYMAGHIFDGSGSSYIAARIYVFERDKMINGQPARMLSADLKKYGGYPQYGFLPADLDSDIPPPPGEAEFVLGPDSASTSLVDSARVAVTWGVTPSIALTETQISASWGIPPCVNNSYGRDCVPQPPPSSGYDDLDNLDQHFMYRLAYRNFGGTPTQESIVANITVPGSASTPGHGAIKWFEFRNAGSSTTTPTVYQSGVFDPDNDYRWMGSIAMDKDHDIALGYSRSSTVTKPSIYVNGRLGTDPLNTLGTETLMQAGGGVQYSYNRWGDYSSMTLDPVDQCTFWYTNEYEPSNGSFNWATRIAAFKFPSCTPTSWGQITGTITSCATGTPISGVVVTLNSGYSGATDATGKYTIAVPAGTYTATAAAADRNCSSASPATVSIIVAVDQVVTQDFCMTGTSNVVYKSVAIDDSANGNNNGVVNRNECVNLNVTLTNAGCANESNIAGTLSTTTAGVTITQGTSFFPNLAVDASGASSVPFRIQTSSSFVCGTLINFTLNLSYTGGSKTVTFSVPTCNSGGSQTIPTSSLTAADPTQPDRLYRDGVPSTCSGKTCDGPLAGGGSYYYKTFKFTNTAATPACVTVTINAACGSVNNNSEIASSAYLGSTYTPPTSNGDPKICNNYLGDSAVVGVVNGTVSYSFTVPASSDFVVVVNDAFVTPYTCTQFSGTVSGLVDNTPGPGACPNCTPPPTPTIFAGGATTFCAGGSVTLTSSAASGNLWYRDGAPIGGATGTTYNATATGSYTVTSTANSCTSAPSSATVVTVNPIPAAPAPSNGGPYCAGATMALSTPTVANATYAWTGPNGFTSALQNPTKVSAAAADSGAYSVTVTVNGCTSAAGTTNVVVTALPSTPTASNNGPFCTGQTLNLSTSTVSGATYFWRGPNGFTSTQQNPTKASLTAADTGTYWVTVTANGCTSAGGSTDVVVNTIPSTPTAANGGPYCAGGTIALSTPTVANATYAWTGPNGFTSALQNPTKASAAAADTGTYSVTVTVNSCTSIAGTTNVVVNTAVPATPAANNAGPYCEGGTIALSTPTVASATYAWTGPNGFTSALQNPTKANAVAADGGTYSVTVTVGGCTSAAGTTSVVVNAKPATPPASNGGPYCEGSTIALSTAAVANATYAWTGPNGFTSASQNPTRPNAAAADFGTYSVTVTVNGCTSAAGTTTVVDGNSAAVAANGGPYCVSDTISLFTPAVSGATYAWNGPNGFTSAQQNPTRANAAASDAGTYSVVVTVPGCTSLAGSTNVVVNTTSATPTASNGGPYCEGGTIALSTPAVAGATYAWTGPNGFTSTLQNPTIAGATLSSAGTYSVTLSNGCTSAAGTTTVVVNSAPATPTASNAGPVCGGGTIALFTPTVAGATYAWSGPNGFASALQNPTKANATAADAGTYSVTVTVNGCISAAGTTSVTVNTLATPAPSNGGPYCEGATVSLSTPAVAGATYAWTGPNGFTSTSRTPTITFAGPSASGAYSVTVTANSCTSAAGTTNVVVNSFPAKPTASNSGPYCPGGTISLSTAAVANATYSWTGPNGFTSSQQNPTKASVTVADAGTYSLTITVNGCSSAAGTTAVVVNATPATPTASNGGPYCVGGAISLSTPFVTGATYAWTGPNGFTSTQRTPSKANITAADAGTYSVVVTVNSCPSAAGTTSVVINPTPAAPTISAGGPTSFCTGGSVVLTSSIATGNQWLLNGSPISGMTGQTMSAGVSGSYAVVVTSNGCTSAASNSILVTVSQKPDATIGANTTVYPGSTFNYAFASYYYSSATYAWTITNGTITSGATSSSIYFTAGSAGAVTLQLTITTAPSCSDTKTRTVSIVPSISSIVPAYGRTTGGTTVTITGAGFQSGATVTFGGTAATNVVTASSTSLTATAPAHAAGSALVSVVNPDSYYATVSGFNYLAQFFDPNNDHTIDPSDIFYLVNYLFTNGPAPKGVAGMMSGDANGDNVVDPADIFYTVNYIFTAGPAPKSVQPHNVAPLSGSVTLGEPVVRGGRTFVPVIVDGSPQALSLRVRAAGGAIVAVRRAGAAGDLHPLFENSPTQPDGIAYLVSFGAAVNGVVAELEVRAPAGAAVDLALDPELTMLTDRSGEEKATVANGRLRLTGTTIGRERPTSKPGN